jgi:hypothetical protein
MTDLFTAQTLFFMLFGISSSSSSQSSSIQTTSITYKTARKLKEIIKLHVTIFLDRLSACGSEKTEETHSEDSLLRFHIKPTYTATVTSCHRPSTAQIHSYREYLNHCSKPKRQPRFSHSALQYYSKFSVLITRSPTISDGTLVS